MDSEEFQKFLSQQEHEGKRVGNILGEHFDCFLLIGFSPKGPEARLRGYGNNLTARAIRDALRDELEHLDMLLEETQYPM